MQYGRSRGEGLVPGTHTCLRTQSLRMLVDHVLLYAYIYMYELNECIIRRDTTIRKRLISPLSLHTHTLDDACIHTLNRCRAVYHQFNHSSITHHSSLPRILPSSSGAGKKQRAARGAARRDPFLCIHNGTYISIYSTFFKSAHEAHRFLYVGAFVHVCIYIYVCV